MILHSPAAAPHRSRAGQDTRRRFLLGALATLAWACRPSRSPPSSSRRGAASTAHAEPEQTTRPDDASIERSASLEEVEEGVGGRLGVFAVDTQTGRELHHRADERFALCSTFKWALAAHVLQRAERGELTLEERVPFGVSDLLEHAPITRRRVEEGALSLEVLAEAAVVVSDNTAANLLLEKVGGPGSFTEFLRSLGDDVTRLDRNEPMLNMNEPGDPRDTTSPRAMVHLLRRILCKDALSSDSQRRLLAWLSACETGKNRLRAGLPPEWKVGDKTGGGNRGACNDVAIAWPPGRGPILIASYLSDGRSSLSKLESAHAEVARIVARELQ